LSSNASEKGGTVFEAGNVEVVELYTESGTATSIWFGIYDYDLFKTGETSEYLPNNPLISAHHIGAVPVNGVIRVALPLTVASGDHRTLAVLPLGGDVKPALATGGGGLDNVLWQNETQRPPYTGWDTRKETRPGVTPFEELIKDLHGPNEGGLPSNISGPSGGERTAAFAIRAGHDLGSELAMML
jgi:hypothetical protein